MSEQLGGERLHVQVTSILNAAARGELPPIVQAGHPVLRCPAEPWQGQLEDSQLHQLIKLMRKVMHRAFGVGLAAPQLGLPLQLAVAEDHYPVTDAVRTLREREPLPFLAILNPRYTPLSTSPDRAAESGRKDDTAAFYEGCLSVAGWQAVVARPRKVRLDYLDAQGTERSEIFHGWAARIVQHETDHLGGTLYLDKAVLRSLSSNEEYQARWAKPGIDRAAEELGFSV